MALAAIAFEADGHLDQNYRQNKPHLLADSHHPEQTEANGTQANIIAVWSSSSSEPQNNTVAVAGNGQIQDPASYTSVNGIEYYDVTFGFVDDQDATSSTKPELLRF